MTDQPTLKLRGALRRLFSAGPVEERFARQRARDELVVHRHGRRF